MERLAPGLHRWIARHPAWEPGADPGSPADWPPDVGCVAYEAPASKEVYFCGCKATGRKPLCDGTHSRI